MSSQPRVPSQRTQSMNVLFPPKARAGFGKGTSYFQASSLLVYFILLSWIFFSVVQLQLVYIKILAQPRAWGVMSQALRDSPQDSLYHMTSCPRSCSYHGPHSFGDVNSCLVFLGEEEVPCLAAANNHVLNGCSAFLGPRSSWRKSLPGREQGHHYNINKPLGSYWAS